jgi:hypothetical protein
VRGLKAPGATATIESTTDAASAMGRCGMAVLSYATRHHHCLSVDLLGAPLAQAVREAGGLTQGRERSETNCGTCRCKSCRRNSPFGAVVISGSPRGDLRAGSPDVKA